MEDYKIDTHKLIYHPKKVVDWLDGKTIYPINAEVALSGACNHRCVFCCIDYMGYVPSYLTKEIMHIRMQEMHRFGLRSVVFAGNGEPLLNPNAVEIINDTKKKGIDVALSTNGVLFSKDVAKECMHSISWIRFSTSGGTEETYNRIHRGKKGDLEKVFNNIYDAACLKRKENLKTVLGVQIVMTPENENEIVLLAKKVKELGADQFSVKSLGWNPMTNSDLKDTVNRKEFYANRSNLMDEINKLNDENFRAVYRGNRVSKTIETRKYEECYASPFHVCIDSNGDMVPCCVFLGIEAMKFGNIYEHTFEDIWEGGKRVDVLNRLQQTKLSSCPAECRLSDMNAYLFELKNPSEHVNFI